jgi:putative tricarboxylic transport membrane protein
MIETVISLLLLLFNLTYLYYASQLSFGSFSAPQAGFMPMLAGITAVILSLAVVAGQLPTMSAKSTGGVNWRKVLFIIIGLQSYILIFSLLGYMAATFIITVYLLKVTDTAGWLYPCLIASVVAGGFQYVFAHLLQINLP